MEKTDMNSIISYGLDIQKQIAEISRMILQNIEQTRVDEITDTMNQIIYDLGKMELSSAEKNASRKKDAVGRRERINRYHEMMKRVEQMEHELEAYRITLIMDSAVLTNMKELNQNCYDRLIEKIAAANRKIEELQMQKNGQNSEEMKWLNETVSQIGHRVEELGISQVIARQQASQIQMLQDNAASMIGGLQSTLLSVIPLWKTKMITQIHKEQNEQLEDADLKLANQLLASSLGDIVQIQEDAKGNRQDQ